MRRARVGMSLSDRDRQNAPPSAFGRRPPAETFRADLAHARARAIRSWSRILGVAAIVLLIVLAGAGAWVWHRYLRDTPTLPGREALFAVNRAPGIRFQDATGQLIATRGPRYGERVTLKDLPPYVPQAFLAAEDRRFYQHGPIDPYGIIRSAWVNWRAGEVVQGGSTLSQQLAKGLFLTPDQTVERKLQEMLMAARLERVLSKDEVLELYLNRIFFGANTFGIDGASRTYFGKPASQLTISEAALLAALPKAPSRLALTRGMSGALARQKLVLARMRKERWIDEAQYRQALAETPRLSPTAQQNEGVYGYLLDYATSEAIRIAGPNSPDLVVKLTVDPRLQAEAAKIVREVMATDGAKAGAGQAALVALSEDGGVRAMIGGRDYSESVFNRAVQARRQPGSTFKPFVYAAAIDHGVLPTDIRQDAPIRFGNWRPQNYGGGYRGPITVESALINSINTVAVRLAQEAGVGAVSSLARRFGITTLPPQIDLSVALGAYEVTLIDMTSAFQVFQHGGERTPPHVIDAIATVGGQSLFTWTPPKPDAVYGVEHASMMVKMMKKVVQYGTAQRASFGRPAAGKTGTSQNWRDAWFVGFTPDFAGGVWVGNDDDKPMNKVVGGDLPATIWRRFMIAAHEGLPPRDFPFLTSDVLPATNADPRNGFYDSLAAEFGRAAAEARSDAPIAPNGAPDYVPPSADLPY
ncbi:MAG: PBP1A family penicillin-binding protein [Caulobacterales bacterium]|nr:PBP1A family penicillin-binding protein [Caulobacterales bacterium]